MENRLVQGLVPAIIAGLVAFASVYFGFGARLDTLEQDVARHNVNERDWNRFQGVISTLATKEDLSQMRVDLATIKVRVNQLSAAHSSRIAASVARRNEYMKGAAQ